MCQEREKYYILFDVGGTNVKACVMKHAQEGSVPDGRFDVFPALSNASREEIFDNFAAAIQRLSKEIEMNKGQLSGIGMAFPGPFDYTKGISLMRGLNKYDAIYGCRIQEWLEQELAAPCPFLFLHDVEAFAIGECRFGKARGKGKVLHICIGTGTGSAFTNQGLVLKEASEQVPANGWIYSTPFRDGRVDDYLSARGLAVLAKQSFLNEPDGKQLYDMACNTENDGERDLALSVFQEFGANAREIIEPLLIRFAPQQLIMGGQIAAAHEFFGENLRELCRERNVEFDVTEYTSLSIARGLYYGLIEQQTEWEAYSDGTFM